MAAITLPARLDSLAPCTAFVAACATAEGVPPQRVSAIELAVEEALVNICRYAYRRETGEVEVHCTRNETQHLLIDLIDTGEPFNILTLPIPDLTTSLDDRQVGGLGVLLIQALVDHVTYRHADGRNILQLAVRLPS
ncbi:MAG: ATP-binding protein [Candidatus Tectomicrobia bacterium]|nr:ATP-binding protein [Candidatus Tectomicrobia bacterium]